ncbi:thermonuclease family protein [Sphingobacteriaceae bacterium WQ 2009]|uniref:Thermonuclease family protein n=1 Tax=Rhinopithecimicrobium faecis TaxID=2820698 RepID=A0A8T4HBY5_9SPHI|nr:thermonuclease family protein [Sphingobacteriaceae bacterium WQ 2009]
MKRILFYLLLITGVIVCSCTSKSEQSIRNRHRDTPKDPSHNNSNKNDFYFVNKVVDGDTFWVNSQKGGGFKIRLIGVDAPESRNVFKKKKHPYGHTSKKFLIELIQNNYVRLEFDVDSLDQYGRTLAYAYLENGEMVNEILVKTGNGQILTIAPNVKYETLFLSAQRYARKNSLGLWAINISE